MKLTIKDGRDSFYTFDSNRILLLTATDEEQIKQIEFSTEEAGGTETWTKDVLEQEDGVKYVQVPNEFLNGDYTRLVCYAVALDSKGEFTRQKEVFRIKYRPQPEDWFLTYSERVTFASIKALTEQYKSNASDSAELASKYAENNEDVAVESGKYSAKHWSIKSNKKYEEIRSYVGSASDPESALGSIESARANAVSDVEKQETDSIEAVGTYTSNTAIPSVSQYVEGTAKPALKTYGEQQVDSYVNGTSKPELDRYVNNEKKQVLDQYTEEKKSELDSYTNTDKKKVLDDYVNNVKKVELNTYTNDKKSELDVYKTTKADELNEHTVSLKGSLDGYTTAKKEEISVYTEQKKAEIGSVYTDDLNELKGDLVKLNDDLEYFPTKKVILSLGDSSVNKSVITGIHLKKGVTYELISSILSVISNNLYVYLKDNNGNNLITCHIANGKLSNRNSYTPTEDMDNVNVYIISSIACELTLIFRACIDGVRNLMESLDYINPLAFSDIKHLMPWAIADIAESGELGDYKFRLSSSEILSYPFDIIVSVDSEHRYGWVTYENGQRKSWSGWNTENKTISKGTEFRLQLARTTNESSTPIYDEKDNDIYRSVTIKAIEDDEKFTLIDALKTRKVASALWSQGACVVGDKIVGFNSANNDHSTNGNVIITNANDFTSYGSATQNLGHCNSADYDSDLDVMATICGETLYIVKNFENKVTNISNLVYGDADIIEISLDGLNGNMAGVCFGETNHILYIASLEDALNFSTKGKRWIYRVILGFGSNNMFEQFSSDNLGTFISGCSDDEFNGTIHILNIFEGEFLGEIQGLRYLNGNIIFSTDLYVNNVLTPFIAIAKLKYDGTFELVRTKNVPYFNANGVRSRTEAEDVVFHGDYGYICVVDHSTWGYNILQFDKIGIFN